MTPTTAIDQRLGRASRPVAARWFAADAGSIGRRAVLLLALPLQLLAGAPATAQAQYDLEEEIRQSVRGRMERLAAGETVQAGGEALLAAVAAPMLYERRLFRPLWIAGARPGAMAHELVGALGDASAHGLWPGDYHEEVLEGLLARSERPGNGSSLLLADLDLLLTDAFLVYASHLVSGRVDPETLDPEWITVRREVDLVPLLEEAVGDGRVAAALADLAPDHPGYRRLQDALSLYRRITAAGGWQTIAEGPTIELGREADPVRLAALAARLRATDDLEDGTIAADEGVYAGALETALRRFQERHGLEVDGKVGPKTLAALNVPVAARVEQIEINLERWRWLPQELGERYVLVNIPDFRVTLVVDGETALEMRAVVGLSYRRTPVFSDLMRYLVVNPSWEVPSNIAVQDKLPLIRQDPAYLLRQRMHVYSGWGSEQVEIDPATVDWSALGRGNFPYRLRQDPGPWNALGGVKFMFPNRFNVYLHDTPTRELFGRAERAASSGCIRLEKALELAAYLLADTPGWSRDALERAVRTPPYRERTLSLARPVPVHILYWTAWADEEGTVHFRADLYGRDRRLAEALRRPAPEAPAPIDETLLAGEW